MSQETNATNGRGEPSPAYTGRGQGWNELAERLAVLSRDLQDKTDVPATLQAIVVGAVDTVPGAEQVSISSVVRRRKVETLASTGDLARMVDRIQYDTGEGPCLSALYERRTFRMADLDGTPWPTFAAQARKLGLGSMLAIQLFVTGEDLGVLNIFSTRPDAFGDESEQVALLFAAHAAVALVGAQRQAHMSVALNARDVIGQAKGVLMERYKINADEAFRLLVVASQNTNVRLREVAEHLTETGAL